MKIRTLVLLSAIVLFFSPVFGQGGQCGDLNPNSGKLLDKGIQAYDNGQYEKALGYYSSIFPGDTNYYTALYEIGLTYGAMKLYESQNAIAHTLINMNEGSMLQNINMLGNSLDDQEKTDEALKVYDDAIIKFPNEYLLHYNRGLSLFRAKRFEEAEKSLIRAGQLNPFHQGSHYLLGVINMMAKRYVQGMMALEYAMILNTQGTKYSTGINILDESSVLQFPEKKDEIELSKNPDDAGDFDAVNEIYISLLALNSKYKPKKLPNYRVVKQTSIFLENMENVGTNNKSFYTTFYLPFYKKIKERSLLRTMMGEMLSSLESEEIQKFALSEKKNFPKLTLAFTDFLKETGSKVKIKHNGKEYDCSVEYYSNGSIKVAYELNAEKTEISKDGLVIVFYEDGGVLKEAHVKDNKLTGETKLYRKDGTLFETNTLVDGQEQGAATEYYRTGEPFVIKSYKDGEIDGDVKILYPDGQVKMTFKKIKGVKNGEEKFYFNDGKLSYSVNYKNGDYEGPIKTYYNNGKPESEYGYKSAKLDGVVKNYFANGRVKNEQTYINGMLTGGYKSYHPNGNVMEEGLFDDKGKRTGTWKEYYYNGILSTETSYTNGEKQGKGADYSRDGKKYCDYEYNGGNYTVLRSYDENGTMTHEFKEDKGTLKYSFYTIEGVKVFDGQFKNGKRDGLWTFYFPLGGISNTTNYKNGNVEGEMKNYYANDVLKNSYTYKDDEENGPVVEYFPDGAVKTKYCATNDRIAGQCINYYPNGKKQNEVYYLDGYLNGPVLNYDMTGKIHKTRHFNEDSFTGEVIYDSLGKEIFSIKNADGLVTYEKKYPNGKIMSRGSYLNGELHDSLIFYFPDGKINSFAYYENGKREGDVIIYDHLGNLQEKRSYQDGKLEGTSTTYFRNGKVARIFQYADNKSFGKTEYFYSNGNKEFEVEKAYNNNEGWGVWYDESGHEAHKTYYVGDNAVFYTYKDKAGKWVEKIDIKANGNKMVSYHSNGKKFIDRSYTGSEQDGSSLIYLSTGGSYRNNVYTIGEYNGESKEYYANGKLMEVTNYWMGQYHGAQKYYNDNGVLVMELMYEYGNLNGPAKYYDKNGKLLYTCIYYQDEVVEIK